MSKDARGESSRHRWKPRRPGGLSAPPAAWEEMIASLELAPARQALVLLSGGLDSAACVAHYLRRGLRVSGLHVDYGQPANRPERSAAEALAWHFGIELSHVTITGSFPPRGNIPGRNGVLLLVGLMTDSVDCGLIATGIHAGTPYEDCSPPFMRSVEEMFSLYRNGVVQPAAPFLNWTKPDIALYARELRVPFGLTYSCEIGNVEPCGQCPSCRDRIEWGDVVAG